MLLDVSLIGDRPADASLTGILLVGLAMGVYWLVAYPKARRKQQQQAAREERIREEMKARQR